MIPPGSVLGVLGSGQLGRMFALAARRMGYRVHTLSPDHDSPTGQVADVEVRASYDDLDAVRRFASSVSVVTFEFENVPAATAAAAAECAPVRPSGAVLHVCQQRLREKGFLRDAGLPVTDFVAVRRPEDIHAGLLRLGPAAILKTAAFGYDGKGQSRVTSLSEAVAAWQALGRAECILEAEVPFEREVSVVAARGLDGAFAHWGVIENVHARHVLDVSVSPASLEPPLAAQAIELAREVLDQLKVTGVLCVEMFVAPGGRLLINELAPRPHNSGHLTVDASVTSQFEQQLRSVCGLPLGSTELLRPAAMVNLLGDLWAEGEPQWARASAFPEVKLHLYGKSEARPGRKMGHLTALGTTAAEARERAQLARRALTEDRATAARA
ncbi:MAG TPA: 5-(carboxyamino)imidazole ribonucleotide synthase [Vicinamibacteria bacterium]|nr:5-(carboxyamino)imidazole ribonucleotide synthase [Vicinamibacteria bacterium]